MIRRYYVCLAINEKDPNDIIGLCEHSFCMNWEKGHAGLFIPNLKYTFYRTHTDYVNKQIEISKRSRFGFSYKNKHYDLNQKNKRLYLKTIANIKSHDYLPTGRSINEYEWKWANHYLNSCPPPKGYVGRVYRVNNKHCPVVFDLSIKDGMDKRVIEKKKYQYLNAKFSLKS